MILSCQICGNKFDCIDYRWCICDECVRKTFESFNKADSKIDNIADIDIDFGFSKEKFQDVIKKITEFKKDRFE